MRSSGGALLLCLACAPSEPPGTPPPVSSVPAPSASEPAPPSPPSASAAPSADRKSWQAGQHVVARGKVSRAPWQHMMTGVEGKKSEYFDLEDGWQIVIYATDLPSCEGLLELEGTVILVSGPSKRPGERTKLKDDYRELQLDVSTARCAR